MQPIESFVAQSLAEAFASCVIQRGDAELVIASAQRGGRYRLSELHEDAGRLASGLRARGIKPGDIVALQLPGWAEWLIAASAIARVGATILPIVSIYGTKELAFILGQTKATAIITPDRWRNIDCIATVRNAGPLPHLHSHIVVGDIPVEAYGRLIGWSDAFGDTPISSSLPQNADDRAMLIYTSGTTSDPKGVLHSSRGLLSEVAAVTEPWDKDATPCFLSPWPPGHIAGITPLLAYLTTGRKLVLLDQWDAREAARLIEREQVTVTSFTPFHIAGLIDAVDRTGADISTLGECSVGAAPVAPSLVTRCEEMGMRMFHRYGATEHPSITAGNPGDPLHKRLETEGRPMPGNEVRIVDEDGRDLPYGTEGEIVTRGPELFLGYFDKAHNEGAMLSGGWYRTGDIGKLDAEGYLHLTDRKKDIIIRGGENISSREVEDVLGLHPSVAEASVVAKPNERTGEQACAFVVLRSGQQLTLDDVRAHFSAAAIAKQKTPEHLVIVSELPRNATGKILKHELRRRAAGE